MNQESIKKWFSKKENIILCGLILLTLIIRIYYFILTKNQPLWWDEADYMNIGKSWIGLYLWDFNPLRPILFPLVFTVLLKIGLGELTMKLLVIFASLISIFFLYKLGELFFNKITGLIAAFLLSIFWSFSFYSYRLLVDVPVACLWIVTIYSFFYAYFNNKSYKYYILPGVLLGLSFLMKGSSVLLVLLIALYLIITERSKVFSSLKNYVFYGASLLTILPYLIWEKIKFGSFIAFYTYGRGGVTNVQHTFLESLMDQTKFSFNLLDASNINPGLIPFPLIIISFLIGAGLILFSFLLYEKIIDKNSSQNKNFFLSLWLLGSLIFFGWMNYGDYMDERYYFVYYPVIFLFSAYGLSYIYLKSNLSKKKVIGLIIILLLAFSGYQQLSHADEIVKAKVDSFDQLKQAGLYVRENSAKNQNFTVNEEMAELIYYAERQSNKEGTIYNVSYLNEIIHRDKPSYIVFSNFYYLTLQKSDAHMDVLNYVFTNRTLFTPVKAFGPAIDNEGKIPLVVVFKVNY